MFTLPIGFITSSDITFLTYAHTWIGDADIQGNEAVFDGAGDALTVPDNALFDFGTNDFTVEALVTVDSEPQNFAGIIGKFGSTGSIAWLLYWDVPAQAIKFLYSVGGTTITSVVGTALTLGVESHVAVSRVGSNIRLFIDGDLDATSVIGAGSIHDNNPNLTQGAYEDSVGVLQPQGYFGGSINYSKISSVGLYTTAFTAPSSLSNDPDTIYLNSFQGTNGDTPSLNTE